MQTAKTQRENNDTITTDGGTSLDISEVISGNLGLYFKVFFHEVIQSPFIYRDPYYLSQ